MTGRSTTRLQTSGHRFLLRRMQHALVRGDVQMLDDPMRAQALSLSVGSVLAVIGLGVAAVLAFLQPRGGLGDAPIVMVRDTGALYVRIDHNLHPVPNLASARLITASAAKPRLVSASAVDRASRGASLGIPGAPDMIGAPLTQDKSGWLVCEGDSSMATVLVGSADEKRAAAASVLVSAAGEGAATTYLLFDGRRAKVDLRNPAVVRALELDGVAPRPVTRTLLNTVPEVPELAAPAIRGAGAPAPAPLHGLRVGAVIRVPHAESSQHYVVLRTGVQRIGIVAADLIRFTQPQAAHEIVTVEPGAIGTVPVVDELPVGQFPERAGAATDPVVCARWQWSAVSESVVTGTLAGDAIPDSVELRPAQLAHADAEGPRIDAFAMSGGRSAYVRAAGVTGDGARSGTLFLVNDAGVVFGIRDQETAERLGLTGDPLPAPWPLLARLPRGPELSVEAASVASGGVGPT
ncbi:type VII secretion protein EccB [Mycobacterium sp. 852014-52144_SCH5372336]|uniref:type VII secretion protein EccB n=1 Tax=Mycobacterium sp. 852014-52144_SCH5372336 TaxID=1834115 RepID=UPI0008021B5A|nr:type VII secretion protein EccB [Mycobacterium sp. 852014-52144_SCH5372336]OBB77343.1 type VII secretion protein EccB [Mycobacterium sp. 852014-52144_SCH5372336]